jgi:hypothetical protein
MRAQAKWAVVLCCQAAVLTGCGGGSSPAGPTPPPTITYENLAGTWTGSVGGVTQGVTLAGTLTLTLQQATSAISGNYGVMATLTFPSQQASPLQGSVTLTGTVASGPNPSVNFTTTSVPCPNLPPETWAGSYGSGNGVLTITGTAHVINVPVCTIVLSYPQTILLSR